MDVSAYPLDIQLPRKYAVALESDAFADLVQQLGRFSHLKSVSDCHLGGLILGHRFDLNDIHQDMKNLFPALLGRLLNSYAFPTLE